MDLEEISSEYWEDPIKWECDQYGYSVIKNIAIGSFGDIKLANAEDSALERREQLAVDADAKGHSLVAVKIVHTGNDDYASDILPREVNTLRRLHHPNVMKMYEYFYVAARTYIVLEYCGTNGRLGEFIRQYRAGRGLGLAEDAVRHFTKQLVNGMKYVHKRGIVHRDLRADNILLDDKYNIKISGFGYATKLEKGVGLVDLSDPSFEEKTSRLALEYTPAEAFSYDKYLGKPADVWSLGVVLYMMLAGKKPFTAPQHKSQQVRASLYCKAVWERSGKQSYSNRISKEAKILSRKLLDVKDDARPTLKQLSASRWLKNAILQPDRLMNLVRLHKDQYRDLAGVGEAERAPSEIDQEPLFMFRFHGLTAPNPWRNGPELSFVQYKEAAEVFMTNRRPGNTPHCRENAFDDVSPEPGNINKRHLKQTSDVESQSGVASPRSGVASPQSGMASPQSGVASPQSGVASPQSGVASPQSGVASPQSGMASPQSSVASPQSGVASPQSGVASPQSGVASPQSSVASPQSGVASPQSSVASPQSGVAPPQPGVASPPKSGVASPQSGVASPQSGVASPQSGVASPQSGMASPQSSVASPQSGVASPQSGVASPQSGVASPQSSVASPQSGVASPQSSVASPQSGVAPPQPGVASPPKSDVASPIGRAHDDAYPSGNATPDVKPRRHVEKSDEEKSRRARRGRNLVPMKQTGVGNLVGASGFVPKPPPGKKCVAGGVATPPFAPGQRPASQAQIKKRGRRIPDSGSKGKNNRELTTNKSGSFKARTPSPFHSPPPECRTHEEPQEGVSKYLEDGGPCNPNRFIRETKGVKKVPAKRTSRFKARTPSPSSPCPSPPPECLTQEEPEEDGVLTYLGGGGPTMKLSPDGRKLLPVTQKDVGNLVASTGFVPKPPPGKKCVAGGVATPPSGQRSSSHAQINKRRRRIQQIDSGSNRQKDGDLNKNGRLTQKESVGGVLKLEDGGPCSPNRFTRDTKMVEKLPAKRTSRFKARTPSPSSPCPSPPPECLTQEEPEEDGVLTYLGGGGPTMKLSPDGRKLLPMTRKDVDGTSFVPKPPSGKKCVAGGEATPPPGQRPASQAQIRKRGRKIVKIDSGSTRAKDGEMTASTTSYFKARTPSTYLTTPPECLTQEESVEGALKLEDGGPCSPNRFTREKKGVEKLPAKRTSRFKARTPSPSSPCPSPPPECLTQEEPEEDGVLTYLGGGGPTMKLSPDGRKLLPVTQKDVGNLVASTGFVPKPPPGKKCVAGGVATPPSEQRSSSHAQIKKRGRRIQQIDSGSNRQKDGDLSANINGRFKARKPSPCPSPPPECLNQEEPEEDCELTYLDNGGPCSLKPSTLERRRRNPDVGPWEVEKGDGEDGSVSRCRSRISTKPRSDAKTKISSRKNEGDARVRPDANDLLKRDDSCVGKRGKSRRQRHRQDGAGADKDGGHAVLKTSGRGLLPPIGTAGTSRSQRSKRAVDDTRMREKKADSKVRLPPIYRKS
ncbi:uncharacterized protein LOC144877766 [Branchiostoma floridae x Branchiostoma japonicum]